MPDQTKVIVGTAVAVGTLTAAGLVYLYSRNTEEPIPTKWKKVGEIIDLNFFPVKSCAPIKQKSFECHNLGIHHEGLFDRGFIVARSDKQATARSYPNMVLIQPKIEGNKLILSAPGRPNFVLDLNELRQKPAESKVECWYSKVAGIDAGDAVSDWLSEYILGVSKKDQVWKAYRKEDAGTYHDKTSYFLVNQASVDNLSTQVDHVVKTLQFRPNLVIKGPQAYAEDNFKWVRVGENVIFRVLKPCTRCIFTNIDPDTGLRNPNREPLETLTRTRTIIPNLTPVMGAQMGIRVEGMISVGDSVYINVDDD